MAHVLIVDDEQWALDSLLDVLRERGHRWKPARSAAEAEDRLSSAERFDAVILDMIVPLKSIADYIASVGDPEKDAEMAMTGGANVYATIRHRYPSLPVVIYSVREKTAICADCPNIAPDTPFFRKGYDSDEEIVAKLEELVRASARG